MLIPVVPVMSVMYRVAILYIPLRMRFIAFFISAIAMSIIIIHMIIFTVDWSVTMIFPYFSGLLIFNDIQ